MSDGTTGTGCPLHSDAVWDGRERCARCGFCGAGGGSAQDSGGYGGRGQVLVGETEHGDAVWLHVDKLGEVSAALVRDAKATAESLTAVQARCTELVEERRAVDWTEQLRAMFRAFDQELPERPAWPSDFVVTRRVRLIREEAQETFEAFAERDMVEAVDGLVDLAVVALGGLLDLGVDPRPVWAEVWRTNMAKANGPVSAEGKRLKPPGWVPPAIEELLVAQGWTPPKEAA